MTFHNYLIHRSKKCSSQAGVYWLHSSSEKGLLFEENAIFAQVKTFPIRNMQSTP